jgi:hypothetical protein
MIMEKFSPEEDEGGGGGGGVVESILWASCNHYWIEVM